ncbi:MAG: hypothetical protein ACTSPW_10655 [Promethearchaeota archaeon]
MWTKTLRRWDKRGVLKPSFRRVELYRRYDRRIITRI